MRWLALILYFSLRVTTLAVFGHKVIAIARMAGFNAFRNTYRPFESTSIAEFYNRVYWYFKEMLVAFFFYPSYLRYFKTRPKLRLFTATLAAAALGNFVFHFFRDDHFILRHGFGGAMKMYLSYAVYALVLGVAIALSQLRVLNRKHHPAGWRKAIAIAGVLLFYCLICVVEEPNYQHDIADYGNYLISLFRV
jgi:D-alanyl-lipoteichoic acid acyltransferase DltB (MBOAT superfamily)